MSVITREELMEQLKEHLGENADDKSLALIENISDTFTDLEEKAKGDGIDWKAKCEETDKSWREKYRERFFSGSEEHNDGGVLDKDKELKKEDKAPKTFDELFK